MRLLTRYILKQLFLPFIFSLLIIVFILFTQFLLRAIDRFLGKGLDLGTIFEYLFLNLGWITALAVPMAVLIAALMAFGQFSEDNEITAMRASGISFLTIVRPALALGFAIAATLILFNAFIMPEMNFKARMLSGDIYRKRPDLNIEPGYFMDDLPDYSLIIRDKEDNTLKDVRIFSKGIGETQTSIHSKTGNLSTIDDAILLTLFNGEIHELDLKDYGNYRRIEFEKHIITIPADDLFLNRRDTTSRSDREMTIQMILKKRKDISNRINIVKSRVGRAFLRTQMDSIVPPNFDAAKLALTQFKNAFAADTSNSTDEIYRKEKDVSIAERQLRNEYNLLRSYRKSNNKYEVELHKKFSLPVACILFIMTGASLGVLFRKGGFTIATSLSFGFFLVYYIFMIGGEDLADRNILSPVVGIWSPNLLLFIIATYLLLHTVREQPPLRINLNIFKRFKKNKDESDSTDTA
ncbi:MAG: LptF/LptG family permease [Candidatus Marinimicrobia bacterium]|nr:LptF/LptG family permease [Candidatus Neomarinimicrobiota bacterium]MBL7010988.1 LptF/LptG family permease [Candidatus Neomarinimicrobiota bacterium]MBL7031414.1 LptF/LptG family permease [Candidatus Neomarinimicrobiota bacterium]